MIERRSGSALDAPQCQLLVGCESIQDSNDVQRSAPALRRITYSNEAILGTSDPAKGLLIVVRCLLKEMPHGNPRLCPAQRDDVIDSGRIGTVELA